MDCYCPFTIQSGPSPQNYFFFCYLAVILSEDTKKITENFKGFVKAFGCPFFLTSLCLLNHLTLHRYRYVSATNESVYCFFSWG